MVSCIDNLLCLISESFAVTSFIYRPVTQQCIKWSMRTSYVPPSWKCTRNELRERERGSCKSFADTWSQWRLSFPPENHVIIHLVFSLSENCLLSSSFLPILYLFSAPMKVEKRATFLFDARSLRNLFVFWQTFFVLFLIYFCGEYF